MVPSFAINGSKLVELALERFDSDTLAHATLTIPAKTRG